MEEVVGTMEICRILRRNMFCISRDRGSSIGINFLLSVREYSEARGSDEP
jgi:hypothetical protein